METKVFKERCRIVSNHYEGMMCKAYMILHDRQKAEQVVQEACELFLSSKEVIYNPPAWLHKTVKNLACALKKSDSQTISLERVHDVESKLLNPLDSLLDKENTELIRQAIRSLPDIYRDAVMLYYFDGKSTKEAANLQEVNIKTFLSRLHRARRLLYGLLGGYRRDALK